MKQYVGRMIDLKTRLNNHLIKLTGIKKDFVAQLKQNDILDLKIVLSDINNLLTLNMTISAVNWLCDLFQIDNYNRQLILKNIDEIKPNTSGYDIQINSPFKVIGEVKCIVPINNGDRFGSNQWDSILGDGIKLKAGKKSLPDSSNHFKFLFLIDLGIRTDEAISQLTKHSKTASNDPNRTKRHQIKDSLALFHDSERKSLSLDKIYIKPIKLDVNLD